MLEAESTLAEADDKAGQKLSENVSRQLRFGGDRTAIGQACGSLRAPFNPRSLRRIVQELTPKSIGEVIRAGDPIARIVPTNRELVAEVRIDPRTQVIFMRMQTRHPAIDF